MTNSLTVWRAAVLSRRAVPERSAAVSLAQKRTRARAILAVLFLSSRASKLGRTKIILDAVL
jgi:hypothetical protein